MKTGLIIVIIVVLALLVAGGIYLATRGTYNTPVTTPNPTTPNPTPTPNPNPTPPPVPPSAGVQTYNVGIMNFAFSPDSLTIKAGDTVIWTNNDNVAHTVTSDSGSELGSPHITPGNSYSHTFSTAGTYNYHCSIHTTMKGIVIVQ